MDRKQQGVKRKIQEATGETTSKKMKVDTNNKVSIKFADEPLNLTCMWDSCGVRCNSWEKFEEHLIGHVDIHTEHSTCLWDNCSYNATVSLLKQHLSYHGYISKLCSIGQNTVKRRGLPECKQRQVLNIPIEPLGYTCQWKNCLVTFNTIFEFLNHLVMHVKNVEESEVKKFDCDWIDCRTAYSDRHKLADHLKVHSKEKLVACPTCLIPLSNRTTLIDHRTRQLQCGKNYTCSECPKVFPSERLRREHAREHAHAHKYQCRTCGRSFRVPSHLVKHFKAKHWKDQNKCGQLQKVMVGNGEKARLIKSEEEKLGFSMTGENEWNPSFIKEESIDIGENVLKIESEEELQNLEFKLASRSEYEKTSVKMEDKIEGDACKIEWEGKLLNLEFNLTNRIGWEEMENDEKNENVCIVSVQMKGYNL